MARADGAEKNVRKKPRPLNYFYLDGQMEPLGPTVPLLHKKLHISRATDTIVAWCYPLHKRVAYTYSDVRQRKQNAFSTMQVAGMLHRSRVTIERAIINGDIRAPQKTYGLNERKNGFAYYWCERDVLDAHAFFSTVHRGRPRKDGLITPGFMPSVRELRAVMRDEEILYVRQGDRFLPTWRAEQF